MTSPGARLARAFRDAGSTVVLKHQPSAFYATDLELQLARRGIRTIVLGGISTNIGVEATARAANEREIDQIFVEDAMAAREADLHEHAGRRYFPTIGRVRSTDQVLAALAAARPSRERVMDDYRSFAEFYPHYLEEHAHRGTRAFHFIGTAFVLFTLGFAIATRQWRFLWLLPVFGYGFAWLGHLSIEHNHPTTFRHPLYSLAADFRMFVDMLRGRIPL